MVSTVTSPEASALSIFSIEIPDIESGSFQQPAAVWCPNILMPEYLVL
jgi:hypothetical protein